MSPFLSRLACQILSLTDKHGITLLPAYIPTHLNVEADFLSWDWLLPEWHLLPQVAQAAFHLWGLPEVDLLASSHSTQCQQYFTLETPLPEWASWCAQQGLPNNAISAPKLEKFLLHLFLVAWHTMVSIVMLFLHFWSLISFTRHLIILSFRN